MAVPQPASRPAAPAAAAMAIRIRADVISLPPPVVARVVTLGMTLFGARWLRPARRAAYHGIDTMPNNRLEAQVPETFTTRPQLAGTFGMVASTHWLASAAGMAVLEKGGNAFDAAVATGLVLQVVEPHLNGPGGEVPVIGFSAAAGDVFVLDGQGPAPGGGHAGRVRRARA